MVFSILVQFWRGTAWLTFVERPIKLDLMFILFIHYVNWFMNKLRYESDPYSLVKMFKFCSYAIVAFMILISDVLSQGKSNSFFEIIPLIRIQSTSVVNRRTIGHQPIAKRPVNEAKVWSECKTCEKSSINYFGHCWNSFVIGHRSGKYDCVVFITTLIQVQF